MDFFKYRWYLIMGAAELLMMVGTFLGRGVGSVRAIPGIAMTALLLLSPVFIGISILYLLKQKEGRLLFVAGIIIGMIGLILPLGVLNSI